MYIVCSSPMVAHPVIILGSNDSELVLWPVEWRLISGWSFAQFLRLISPRCPHEETLGPYLPIAKFRGVSPRNLAECLREMSRSFSANFCGVSPRNFAEKTLGEISDFYLSLRKKLFRARGVPRRNAKKELFSWADLYIVTQVASLYITIFTHIIWNKLSFIISSFLSTFLTSNAYALFNNK